MTDRARPLADPPRGAEYFDSQSPGIEFDERNPPPAESEIRALPAFSAKELAGQDVPFRKWLVRNLVPAETVTLLGGDGGTGKSLLALQLAVATALGRTWIGNETQMGNALFVTAEDDRDEVHRRLSDIALNEGIELGDLEKLTVASLAGEDALLAVPGEAGRIVETPLFRGLRNLVVDKQPVLLVLDTLADLFGGEENHRTHARQFIGILRGLAIENQCTILLLAHPSLSGINSGHGYSGSTAWNNSVRSRLYLDRCKSDDDGGEVDADRRVLRSMKANYSASGAEHLIRWSAGVFVTDGNPGASRNLMGEAAAESLFLDLVRQYNQQDRPVSATPSSNYAPTIFAKDARAQEAKIGKRTLVSAMNRLFDDDRIKVVECGPPSRRRKVIQCA